MSSGASGGTQVEDPAFELEIASAKKAAYDGKVVRGKDGWLFLANDSNHVVRQHTGELRFTPRQLRDWQVTIESRVAWLEKLGIPYIFLVPPDAHSVYAEKLPDGLSRTKRRPVHDLIARLGASESFGRITYPIDRMRTAKKKRLVYSQTDSHWTGYGAFVGYRCLVDEIQKTGVPFRELKPSDVSFREVEMVGGLGYKVEPHQASTQIFADVHDPQARCTSDNCVDGQGSLLTFECPSAPETTCVVFGDSFGFGLLSFLAEGFRRFVFALAMTLDHDLVRRERPDLVITLLTERFLIRVPDDVGGATLSELEQERKAQGIVRPPLMPETSS